MRTAWGVWGLAAGFYLVALFHRMSLGVASLDAQERFGLGAGDIATLSALQLGLYLAMTIPAGLAADRIGPRRALALGLGIIAVGEVAFGLATAAPLALGGRALVGVGDAFMFLSVLRIAQSWFPTHRYALLASLTGMAGAIGQLATTVPLGMALDGAGWTATFAGTGALTAVLALLCLRTVRDRPAGAPAPAAAGHDPVLTTLRRAWRRPGTRLAFWIHFATMGPFVAITALWGYPYLVTDEGVAPPTARIWLAVCIGAYAVSAPLLGILVGRRPALRRPLFPWTAVVAVAAWLATLTWPGGHAPAGLVLLTLVITGIGASVSMLAFDVAREGNPASVGGSATGLANCGGFSMAVITQLVAGRLLDAGIAGSIAAALLPMVALMVLGLTMTLLLAPRAEAAREAGLMIDAIPTPAHGGRDGRAPGSGEEGGGRPRPGEDRGRRRDRAVRAPVRPVQPGSR